MDKTLGKKKKKKQEEEYFPLNAGCNVAVEEIDADARAIRKY